MNKKGSLQIAMLIILGIIFVLVMILTCIAQMSFPELAEEKCQEIGLELFDCESRSVFIQSSITCINKSTNEIVRIR